MALQFSEGFPADTLGSDGDYKPDTKLRYFYGLKSSGTWANVGTYALQAPTGPALLSGPGAPLSSFGAQGQGYVDLLTGSTYLKNSSGWGLQGSQSFIGPPGPTGTTYGAGTANMAANTTYVWGAAGSGTGQVYVNGTYAG